MTNWNKLCSLLAPEYKGIGTETEAFEWEKQKVSGEKHGADKYEPKPEGPVTEYVRGE